MAKKKNVDLFGDDQVERPQNEFDALLNSNSQVGTRLAPGDRFRAEVLAVSGAEAFVSTGTPTDAVMPFALNSGEDAAPAPKTGDVIEVVVVRVREGEILVKPVGSRGVAQDSDSLEDAFDMELPVEGVVLEAVKGGFRVKVQALKAFCPISQIDFRCTDANDYVGKKFDFIITKWERGRDLVVSRRKLLEIERAQHEGEFMAQAKEGDIFTGTIFRLEKYGAFIRIDNGLEGLIPISELSFGRIGHPQEVVNLNQTVQVKLMRATTEGDRMKLSFSLKSGGSVLDPWATIQDDLPMGTQLDGIVDHKEAYGLFVRVSTGLTGLLPRSAWRDSTEAQAYEMKRKGDTVKVRIAGLDIEARKISLSLAGEEDDESWRDSPATANKKASFGTLGDLLKSAKPK